MKKEDIDFSDMMLRSDIMDKLWDMKNISHDNIISLWKIHKDILIKRIEFEKRISGATAADIRRETAKEIKAFADLYARTVADAKDAKGGNVHTHHNNDDMDLHDIENTIKAKMEFYTTEIPDANIVEWFRSNDDLATHKEKLFTAFNDLPDNIKIQTVDIVVGISNIIDSICQSAIDNMNILPYFNGELMKLSRDVYMFFYIHNNTLK